MGDSLPSVVGGGRFVIERALGHGAMGEVYLARDAERGGTVALKTLSRSDAAGIYRFKQEFRSLADVSHPNLVVLHELFVEDELWFFTMEHVPGRDFLAHVWGQGRSTMPPPLHSSLRERSDFLAQLWRFTRSTRPPPMPDAAEETRGEPMVVTPMRDEARLREAFQQLAEGVRALHFAGKVHRDLKPSNVLVSREGRVVILDFGLVGERLRSDVDPTLEQSFLGTPAYMSPEQAAGDPSAEPTDWYAFGVMLFEALTGRHPFQGGILQVLAQKQNKNAPAPRSFAMGVPRDLDALCVRLLAREAGLRPTGDEVRETLGAPLGPVPVSIVPAAAGPFIGRARELDQLRAAAAVTDAGQPALVFVQGASGMGKTALVERFVAKLAGAGDTVVLRGRCYEGESVPYKGFDSAVDALSRYLRRLPEIEAARLVPRNLHCLLRVFPVLRRVPAVASAKQRGALPPDPQEVRSRALGAFKELLWRVAGTAPLVITIDDFQWGDVDSARLVVELVSEPDPPPLLLMLSYRSDDVDRSPALTWLLSRRWEEVGVEPQTVTVEPLPPVVVRELANVLVGGTPDPAALDAIEREAAGSPLFVQELARHTQAEREKGRPARKATLADALGERLSALTDEARAVLEVLAVAARPIEHGLIGDTLPSAESLDVSIAALRAGRLLRTVGARDRYETYHDRVREAVVAALLPQRLADCHRCLAIAMETEGTPDLAALAEHLIGAGERVRGASVAERAAEEASDALAFDRAARLLRLALEHSGAEREARARLLVKRGDALVNGRRGADAADAFLEAARLVSSDTAWDLELRAAEQFMASGRVLRGSAILGPALYACGIDLARSGQDRWEDYFELDAQLERRGFAFQQRSVADVPRDAIRHVDLLWAVVCGADHWSGPAGATWVARHLTAALDAGEPLRLVRALCRYASEAEAVTHPERAEAKLVLAERIQAESPDPRGAAWIAQARGLFSLAHFRPGTVGALEAAEVAIGGCTGLNRDLADLRTGLIGIYGIIGDSGKLVRRYPEWVHDADERRELLTMSSLRVQGVPYWLARDDPERARRELDHARGLREGGAGGFVGATSFLAAAAIDAYRGGDGAWRRTTKSAREFSQSGYADVPMLRNAFLGLRVMAALVAAREGRDQAALIESAAAYAAEYAEAYPWVPARWLLSGCVAAARGDHAAALEQLTRYETEASRQRGDEGRARRAAAKWRRGELIGGEEGGRALREAETTLRAEGVAAPARWVAWVAPGFDLIDPRFAAARTSS